MLDTTLCDKVCQLLTAGCCFFAGPPVSSTDKTDLYDIAEILLKVVLTTINQNSKLTWVTVLLSGTALVVSW